MWYFTDVNKIIKKISAINTAGTDQLFWNRFFYFTNKEVRRTLIKKSTMSQTSYRNLVNLEKKILIVIIINGMEFIKTTKIDSCHLV